MTATEGDLVPINNMEDIEDGDALATRHLLQLLAVEIDQLKKVLEPALAAQWTPAPRQSPAGEPTVRTKGEVSNPTADIALDGRRLALRAQIMRSERMLRDTAVTVRAIRRGLERTMGDWEGEPWEGL